MYHWGDRFPRLSPNKLLKNTWQQQPSRVRNQNPEFVEHIIYGKKQESGPYSRKGKKQSIETNSEQEQMLDLADNDFKATTLNVFKELKEAMLK